MAVARVFVTRAATLQPLGPPRLQRQPCLQCARRRVRGHQLQRRLSRAAVQTHLIINSQPGCSAPPPSSVTLTFHNPDPPPPALPLYRVARASSLPAEGNPANRSDSSSSLRASVFQPRPTWFPWFRNGDESWVLDLTRSPPVVCPPVQHVRSFRALQPVFFFFFFPLSALKFQS